MPIQAFVVGVVNYRGFCVAEITTNMKDSDYIRWAIQNLPAEVRYDEYIAVATIAQSQSSDSTKHNQIKTMFGK